MNEYRSSAQYKQDRAFRVSGDVRSMVCFCIDTSGSMKDPLSFLKRRMKIDLLSEVLKNIITGFRNDSLMEHAVAISIVTYNQFAQCKEGFQDAALYEDLNESCRFSDVGSCTNMANGLNLCLELIRSMQFASMNADQPLYPPLLVFMTDGEPTDIPDYQRKFEEIREMVSAKKLHVFPVGIGVRAKMRTLGTLFPDGKKPQDFETKYCMENEEDFVRVFDDIRRLVYEQLGYFVDEVRSKPVYTDENTLNGQGGVDIASFLFEAFIDS